MSDGMRARHRKEKSATRRRDGLRSPVCWAGPRHDRQGLAVWPRPATFSDAERMLFDILTGALWELQSGYNAVVDEFAAKMASPIPRPHVPAAPEE